MRVPSCEGEPAPLRTIPGIKGDCLQVSLLVIWHGTCVPSHVREVVIQFFEEIRESSLMKTETGHEHEVPKQQRRAEEGKHCDRICGNWVGPDTAFKLGFEGKIFYFCSEGCRSNFERD